MRMRNPEFNPIFKAIFSGRVNSQPEVRKAQSKTSSHVESENSRSTMVTIQSRKTNSETSVKTRRHNVKNRAGILSVKTKRIKQTGGTQV